MKTVAQINTLLASYLPRADGSSPATTTILMLNQVLPRLYDLGVWKDLRAEWEADVSAGYFCLPPDYESVVSARLNDYPIDVQTQHYEYQSRGPGFLERPVAAIFGLVDQGYVSLMSDVPAEGIESLTFTLSSGTFASGDNITVRYATTSGVTTFTSSPTSGTSVTLTPASNITSVLEIQYTSIPSRMVVTDPDAYIYAIITPGDGVAQYRRYNVPQVNTNTADEWILTALCKRKFVPLTANTDIVYLDNLTVLKHAFLAVVAEDGGDLNQAEIHWRKCKDQLNAELAEARGGAKGYPQIEIWGKGAPALPSYY